MTDEFMDDIERELGALFISVEHARARRMLPEVGRLEKMAFHLLGRLAQGGPMRPSTLAALVRLDLSTVSRHVAALEAAGLVTRQPDRADRRACLIRAAAEGQAVLARLREQRRQRMRQIFADWPTGDRRELARLLARLNADVDKPTEPEPPRGHARPAPAFPEPARRARPQPART
jgi:DNA-binding MarR family transcriptional regulator